MSSKTPWPLRESDPLWRNDHNYSTGAIRTGSDGAMYTALKPSGPNTADGPKDPVSSPDHWESLKASLMSGGSNEISASDLGAVSVSGDSVAPMAAKLETARKISISGDASGSADGSL